MKINVFDKIWQNEFIRTANVVYTPNRTAEISYMLPTSAAAEITLSLKREVVDTKLRSISATFDNQTETRLYKDFGINSESILVGQLHDEIENIISRELLSEYVRLGRHKNSKKPLGKLLQFLLNTFKVDRDAVFLGPNKHIGSYRHQGKALNFLMNKVSNQIASSSRMGGANMVVVSPITGAILQDMNIFLFKDVDPVSRVAKDTELVGTIGGTSIFVNFSGIVKNDEILVGRASTKIHGTSASHIGVHLVVQTVTTEKIDRGDQTEVKLIATYAIHSTEGSEQLFYLNKFKFEDKPMLLRLFDFLKIKY